MSLRSLVARSAATAAIAVVVASTASAQQPPASPRDSVKATVAGATISVNYGRPSMRGREIFGKLVPWGQVWRTGANAATAFSTSAPIKFGSTTVPAGSYTLYSMPSQDGKWMLIINKQTGQWGTEYKQEMDLARIPLTVTKTAAPVEKFEITVKPSGTGGEIALHWADTKAAAMFTAGK
ncbi:MAG: DUF2911 domain-containing protein [Gemmatimonadaceae bacterium]|jgi:hypothetical protein|nr:DUF2911 domain-containing protein [Gemmatimonadaceae bacterium]